MKRKQICPKCGCIIAENNAKIQSKKSRMSRNPASSCPFCGVKLRSKFLIKIEGIFALFSFIAIIGVIIYLANAISIPLRRDTLWDKILLLVGIILQKVFSIVLRSTIKPTKQLYQACDEVGGYELKRPQYVANVFFIIDNPFKEITKGNVLLLKDGESLTYILITNYAAPTAFEFYTIPYCSDPDKINPSSNAIITNGEVDVAHVSSIDKI